MDAAIKTQYKIVFENKILSFPGQPSRIDKLMHSVNNSLGVFLLDWTSIEDINSDLLGSINKALENAGSFEQNQSQTIGIEISGESTKFYSLTNDTSSPLNPDFVLRTKDFKAIIEGWIEFLNESPLDGSIV